MTDRHFVLILTLLACATLVVLAFLNRSSSAEHDLRRRALHLLTGMTAVPAIALYAAKTPVTGAVAIAVAIIWGIVFVSVMRLVLRNERPP